MKKTNMQKKLQLRTLTVRALTPKDLNAVVGGASPKGEPTMTSDIDNGNQCGTIGR